MVFARQPEDRHAINACSTGFGSQLHGSECLEQCKQRAAKEPNLLARNSRAGAESESSNIVERFLGSVPSSILPFKNRGDALSTFRFITRVGCFLFRPF